MDAHEEAPFTLKRQSAAHLAANGVGEASASPCHARLKRATRLEHDRVDQAISRYDLAQPQAYAAFLRLNAVALMTLRPHWRSVDEADFGGLIAALTVDLAALGVDQPGDSHTASASIDGLGLAYVVRGSRLGSAILRQRVSAGFPTAYFDFKPALPWHALRQQIDERGTSAPDSEHALIDGARATFFVYERLAHREGSVA